MAAKISLRYRLCAAALTVSQTLMNEEYKSKGHRTKAIFLQPTAKISPLTAKWAGLKLVICLFPYGLTSLAAHSDSDTKTTQKSKGT